MDAANRHNGLQVLAGEQARENAEGRARHFSRQAVANAAGVSVDSVRADEIMAILKTVNILAVETPDVLREIGASEQQVIFAAKMVVKRSNFDRLWAAWQKL